MARNIQALLRKKLTGEQVGRIMIEDLVLSYRSGVLRDPEAGAPMTEEEKAALVGSLKSPEDVQRYTQYRYAHEALSHAQANCVLQMTSAEKCFWKVFPLIDNLRGAEKEREVLSKEPQIMTRAQAEAARAADALPPGGVAILPGDTPYEAPGTYLADSYLAEPFLEIFGASVRESLAALRRHLEGFFIAEASIGLAGEVLGVPGVSVLAPAVSLDLFESLNQAMREIPPLIRRDGAKEQAALRAAMRALLEPIPLEALRPDAAMLDFARQRITFGHVQGNLSRLYALLRREEDA